MSKEEKMELKTVLQHINEIKDRNIREKCLANLDLKCADLTCYDVGYALMLGVAQPSHEKAYWEKVYRELGKGDDHSEFYKKPSH